MNQTKAQPSRVFIGTTHQDPGKLYLDVANQRAVLTPKQAIRIALYLLEYAKIAGKETGEDGQHVLRRDDHG